MARIGLRARLGAGAALAACCLWTLARAAGAPQGGGPTLADAECLARNIYHEARGEPLDGQRAVAHVTLNRVADPRWPDTVCDVVYQPRQFSWTQDHLSDEMKHRPSIERAWLIALEALAGYPPDPTHGATHYHAAHVHPRWADRLELVTRIGNHIFYR